MATTAWAAPPTARYTWTGCYVGLNAGAAFNRIDNTVAVPGLVSFGSGNQNTSFTGGGQAGCNLQFDPHWVVGVEGDFNYLHAKANQNFRIRFGGEDTVGSQDTTVRWLATLRGRFGYAWDRWFLYATGGLAFGDVRFENNTPGLIHRRAPDGRSVAALSTCCRSGSLRSLNIFTTISEMQTIW